MFHEFITFSATWVAPVMTGAFFVVLPHLLNNLKPGKH